MVTTPVPPIPIIRTSAVRRPGSGSGRSAGGVGGENALAAPFSAGMIVRNDGQSPSRHE
jgi:hypothetical protein